MVQGPAHCYRRAANVFRNDVGNRSLLCVGADSEDPAICANAGECTVYDRACIVSFVYSVHNCPSIILRYVSKRAFSGVVPLNT
jgi:hypothetical protein